MKINTYDAGASHPWAMPITGQQLGTQHMEGREMVVWARGSVERKQSVNFTLIAWQPMGGFIALSSGAAKFLVKQLEELTSNGSMMPVYIQWNATDDPSATYSANELHDGWYIIDDFQPDYGANVVSAKIKCQMTATQVASKAPNRTGMSYLGGARATNYLGAALPLIPAPVNATTVDPSKLRVGAEGSVPVVAVASAMTASQPEWLVPGGTVSDLFKGGVHVYDTISTGTYPVPATGFVDSHWVEVFYIDHDFTGDCIITNGLHLLLVQPGVTGQLLKLYVWQTGLSPVGWQNWALLGQAALSVLQQFSLTLVCADECAIDATCSGGGLGLSSLLHFRLLRGRYEFWVDVTPQSTPIASTSMLELTFPATPRIQFNETSAIDSTVDTADLVPTPNYGFAGAFIASNTYPFIGGFLHQNQPGLAQPPRLDGVAVQLGDANSLAVGTTRSYGIFAYPFGVAATYSTLNLLSEAESGSLGTGWTNAVDASASGGHSAKAASGTAAGNADLFGTAFVPPAGSYLALFRAHVTSPASAVAEMTLGIWDVGGAAFAPSAVTFAPNSMPRATDAVTETIVANNAPITGIMAAASFKAATTITQVGSFGAMAVGTTSSVSPLFGQATVATHLLTAEVTTDGSAITTGAAGWAQAVSNGTVAIWYKQNCGAGETAPVFTSVAGTRPMRAQLHEWAGALTVGVLDLVGTGSAPLFNTQGSVALSGPTGAGDLLLTAANWTMLSAVTATFVDSGNTEVPATSGTTGAQSLIQHANFTWGITVGTILVWLPVPVVLNGSSSYRFRAVTAGVLATDWWIDEALLVPLSSNFFSQDLWQQWSFDISTKLVRA